MKDERSGGKMEVMRCDRKLSQQKLLRLPDNDLIVSNHN